MKEKKIIKVEIIYLIKIILIMALIIQKQVKILIL